MSTPTPRSGKAPWLRAALMTFVPLVLPMTWVVEIDSCGSTPKSTELTGLELVSKFDLEVWAVMVPVLLIGVATPFIAAALSSTGQRLAVHLTGLLATGFTVYGAVMVLTFSLFTERLLRAAGVAVVVAVLGSFADAIYRVVWSVPEWRASRHVKPRGEP